MHFANEKLSCNSCRYELLPYRPTTKHHRRVLLEDRYYYSVIDRTAVIVLYKNSLRKNSGYKEEADVYG
jgi:hypothetical protein